MIRRYNKWAGNPKGTPEDLSACIVEIDDGPYFVRQCGRKRKVGALCRQHDKQMAAGRPLNIPDPE